MLPKQQKVDISSFSNEEKELFQKYGKVPTKHNLLNKLKDRKYFDSGDYAMQKAGVADHHAAVGTAIPSPADIPHASPSTQAISASTSPSNTTGQPGFSSGSPTNSFVVGSPGKEPIGTDRAANMTFAQ